MKAGTSRVTKIPAKLQKRVRARAAKDSAKTTTSSKRRWSGTCGGT